MENVHTPALPAATGFKLKKKTAFIGFFGISFAAFAAGFSSCLFDTATAGQCVAHAQSWIDPFYKVGMGIMEWALAIGKAAFGS